MSTELPSNPETPPPAKDTDRYAYYALVLLVIAFLFNYVDRNILAILAEEVKRDIGLADSQIGFLYGTAFAVFYAVFGIPFGRLADTWVRKKLIAIGLVLWSSMTALSGTAHSFASLALYRVGVGVGEASLSPCAYSLIVDYFPPRRRATALALYSSGIYFGAGIGYFIGGTIIDTWKTSFPGGAGPFGLRAWQAAFLIVGLPGILLAGWILMLREPRRGAQDGALFESARPEPLQEFGAVIPGLSLVSLWQAGGRMRTLAVNLALAASIAAAAWCLTLAMGDRAQWVALGIGLYAFFSWAQGLALRDRTTFEMILTNRTLVYSIVGFASISFVTNGIAFWSASFFQRAHGISAGRVGAFFLPATAIGGWLGVTVGGMLSDWLKHRTATARVDVALLTVVLSVPTYVLMLTVDNVHLGFVLFAAVVAVVSLWIGPAAALVNELVPPRMRATSSAFYLLSNTFIGFALGPFTVGKISDALSAGGYSRGDSLRYAMMASMLFWIVSIAFLWRARVLIQREAAPLTSHRRDAEAAEERQRKRSLL